MKKMFALLLAASMLGGAALAETTVDATTGASQVTTPDTQLPQEEINALLVKLARHGKKVVRLKGGDPYVFGRGGEEAEALNAAGVAFEVVPGITSAIAGPAYAGIPVTHRRHCTQFTVFTGHEDVNKKESSWT